ncbi:MAG: hypothetical protein FWB86_13785 [Treponema sp.]|nr:hypothetical protein [Treponema sp.]
MTFEPTIFERLLFPLNKDIYVHIQKVLDATGETQKNFNIHIKYNQPDFNIEKLQFSMDFDISLVYIKKPSEFPNGNLLSLAFNHGNVINSFHIPLEYLLGNKKEEILKSESNYVYSYTLLIDKNAKINPINNDVKVAEDINPYLYIGITKKSWQSRNSSNCQNMIKKPGRLICKALNGDFGKLCEKKLVIEKAGLTEDEALNIEEKEVNERSLHLLFPYGLNMIPGGNAGRNLFIKAS